MRINKTMFNACKKCAGQPNGGGQLRKIGLDSIFAWVAAASVQDLETFRIILCAQLTASGVKMLGLLALLFGVIAGLRSMTPPAAVSWAAWSGRLTLGGSWLWFLGDPVTPWVFTIFALGELAADKHPAMPSRKQPIGFVARLCSGGLCGAAVGLTGSAWWWASLLGIAGAAVGTMGGAASRAWLARLIGKDWPAALIEDLVAVGAAVLVFALLP
jgi:uncharacterized membrane protein